MNKKNTTKFIENSTGYIQKKAGSVLMVCVILMGLQSAYAQETVIVEPDNYPAQIGALNQAIEANGGDVIYVLRNGGTYFLDATMEFEHKLHIEAETYPSNNPPIIRPGTDVLGESSTIASYQNDVVMKGIFFWAMDDLGGVTDSQNTSSEGLHLHYQYCYFGSGNGYTIEFGSLANTVRIEDSQFANEGRSSSYSNQRWIDTRGNDQDSIIVINSSIYNFNHNILRDGGALVNNIIFDHVSVVNRSSSSPTLSNFQLHTAKNVQITNSLFHFAQLDGVWESAELVGDAGPGYDGERYVNDYLNDALIEIAPYSVIFEGVEDAPTDADRTIVIKNNNFGGMPPQEYLDLWVELSTDDPVNNPVLGKGTRPWVTDPAWLEANPGIDSNDPEWANRDTIAVVRINGLPLDKTLRAWAENNEPWVDIQNNIEESITIEDMPESMVDYIREYWYGDVTLSHYDRWDDISEGGDPFGANPRYFHPGPGDPINTEGPTASWYRDLSYNTDSQSYTHAENGYPVGNLNFYPELREKWGNGEVLTSIENDSEISHDFELLGNYPNPFNPTTNIAFVLGNRSNVTMEVFNTLGQSVATMELGNMSAGKHEVSFDASNLTSGLYIVRLQMGTQVRTHKITLLK